MLGGRRWRQDPQDARDAPHAQRLLRRQRHGGLCGLRRPSAHGGVAAVAGALGGELARTAWAPAPRQRWQTAVDGQGGTAPPGPAHPAGPSRRAPGGQGQPVSRLRLRKRACPRPRSRGCTSRCCALASDAAGGQEDMDSFARSTREAQGLEGRNLTWRELGWNGPMSRLY